MTSEQEAEAKRWIERLAIHLDSATDILEVEIDEPDDIAEERCFIANAREFLASLAAPPAGVGAEAAPAHVRFMGIPGEVVTMEVAYVAEFPRGKDGLCALCHADPCNESSPPDSVIARFYAANPRAETCPVCEGRPS